MSEIREWKELAINLLWDDECALWLAETQWRLGGPIPCGQKIKTAAESTVSYPPASIEVPEASPVHFNVRDGGRRSTSALKVSPP
jgi:hypothetical protein